MNGVDTMNRVLLRTWSREGITFEVWFDPEYQEIGKDPEFIDSIWERLKGWIIDHKNQFAVGRDMTDKDVGMITEDETIYLLPNYFKAALGAGSLHRTSTRKLIDMGKIYGQHEKCTGKTRSSMVKRIKGLGAVRLVKLNLLPEELKAAQIVKEEKRV